MITKERLAEIKADPREACLFKAEAKELADAYRERVPGLRVTNDADGVWLHFEAPSGKKASISLEALGRSMLGLSPADGGAAAGIERGGLVGATLLEWVEAQPVAGAAPAPEPSKCLKEDEC